MDKEIWYWEYTLKVWNSIDSQEELLSGIVSAETMTEAIKILAEDYYGDETMEIHMLKPITDTVFEFDMVNDMKDFDFTISEK